MFKIMLVSLKIEFCMFCVFGDQQSMSICTCKLLCHVCMRWMKMSLEMYNMLCMIWLKSFLKLPDPYLCIISEVLLQRNVYCCLDWSIFNYFLILTVCGLHFTFWLMVNSTKARNITRNKFSYVCEVDWTIKN